MIDLPGWLLVIPILAFLVLIHELGHFLTAKKFGIKVTEFGFGFPPRIGGFLIGETLYSINWIPLGGFVKMVGEEDPKEPRSFARQSIPKRITVLLAGPFMNLLVPIFIFTILLVIPHDKIVGDVTIGGVAPGSPAQEAGLRSGDKIIKVNGTPVGNHTDLVKLIRNQHEKPTELSVRRHVGTVGLNFSPEFNHIETITVIPRSNPPKLIVVEEVTDPISEVSLSEARSYRPNILVGETMNQGAVGVLIGTANPKVITETTPIWKALPSSFVRIQETISYTASSITGWASGGEDPGLAGPIGIAQVTGEVAAFGLFSIFELTALISISLAIVNILPIPALDGGRLLFVLIEGLRGGKRVSPKTEGVIHMAGFLSLISLIVLMSYFDILRILGGNRFLQ